MARGEPRARGEVAEVRAALASLAARGATAPDAAAARRDLFKKIVHYTTIGIDLSSLFMQVVAAAAPSADDVLLKKMLYWYVATYARAAPDLTLLTINLLTKDAANADPALRATALRTLTALRVPNLVEHAAGAVGAGLGDPHPHVRRAAAAGVLKIYHTDPAAVHRAGWLAQLTALVADDPDAGVVANALAVLRAADALPPASRALVVPLLNRIRDFSDWGQCLVMDVACGFAPRDEEEVFALLNALDDRLGVTNAAIVLSAAKLLLHLTLAMPPTHQALLDRVKTSLLTLAAAGDAPEVAAVALAHLRVLADRAPALFADAAPLLYPLPSDPAYVADAKLALLVCVVDEGNVHDVADELTALAAAPDAARARAAVAALGDVAAAVPAAPGVADRLVGLLDTHAEGAAPGVLAEAVVQAAALVRRAPAAAPAVAAALDAAGLAPAALDDDAGRAALVWLLGEAGGSGDGGDGAYALEPVAAAWPDQPRAVRLALLRAAARLFAARPPEAGPLLRTVLTAGLGDGDADVRDRAALYARLFAAAPDAAPTVLAAAPPPPDAAAADAAVAEALFAEFDTLSVLHRAPAATFVVSGGGGGAGARGGGGARGGPADDDGAAGPFARVGAGSPSPPAGGGAGGGGLLMLVDDILGADAGSALLAGGGDGGGGGDPFGGGGGDDRPSSAAAAASPDPFDVLGGGGGGFATAQGGGGGGGGGDPFGAAPAAAAGDDPFGLGDLLAAVPPK